MKISNTEFAELTPKQIKCLPLIAIGCTASEVAKKFNVSQVQISEWKRDPNFLSALDIVRRNALKDSEVALTNLAMDAVLILGESLNNATSEQTRLRAAIYIIDKLDVSSAVKLKESEPTGTVNMKLLFAALGAK